MEEVKYPVLPDKVYNVIKWIAIIVIPACNTFFIVLAKAWNWDVPVEAIVATTTGLQALMGALLGFSTHQYTKMQAALSTVKETTEG